MKRSIIELFKIVKRRLKPFLCFVPVKRKNKKRGLWDYTTEKIFQDAIYHAFSKNPLLYDSVMVSVIMPVYNRSYCVEKAIESVIKQVHQRWELIIANDGSTDDLGSVIGKYTNDARVRYIDKEAHQGVSATRNEGLMAAKGTYIAYLDSDNEWNPNHLRNMVVFMQIGGLGAAYSAAKILGDIPLLKEYRGEAFNWNTCLDQNYIDLSCFMHKKEEPVSTLFDESLKRLVDWDFILRMTATTRTAYAPFLGVIYYDGYRGNRITYEEYQGGKIKELLKMIQNRYWHLKNSDATSDPSLRPRWEEVLGVEY